MNSYIDYVNKILFPIITLFFLKTVIPIYPLHMGIITIIPSPNRITTTVTTNMLFYGVPTGWVSIDPNLWGLTKHSDKFTGYLRMYVTDDGYLVCESMLDLSSVPLNKWNVIGYPELIYGLKPWGVPPNHPHTHPLLKLPRTVESFPTVIAYTNYSINRYNTGINFAYDIWIKREPIVNGVGKGDIEIMIWLFNDYGIRPAGSKVGDFDMPIFIDNEIRNARWSLWVEPSMNGLWTYIAFVLTTPIKNGSIAIDIRQFLEMAKKMLIERYSGLWSGDAIDKMYVMSIELGTEIFYNHRIDVQWTLYEYMLIVPPNKSFRDAISILTDSVTKPEVYTTVYTLIPAFKSIPNFICIGIAVAIMVIALLMYIYMKKRIPSPALGHCRSR